MKNAAPKTKRKLNVRLLRKIQRHILEEPRRFLMDAWSVQAKTQAEWRKQIEYTHGILMFDDVSEVMPPCGTAACIAGTANLLTGARKQQINSPNRAAKLLGVEKFDGLNHSLFLVQDWPTRFANRYEKAKTPKQRAKVACARIDWLIEHGE